MIKTVDNFQNLMPLRHKDALGAPFIEVEMSTKFTFIWVCASRMNGLRYNSLKRRKTVIFSSPKRRFLSSELIEEIRILPPIFQ